MSTCIYRVVFLHVPSGPIIIKCYTALTYHPSEETSDANNLYQKYSRHYEDVLKREQKNNTAYVIALFLFAWFVNLPRTTSDPLSWPVTTRTERSVTSSLPTSQRAPTSLPHAPQKPSIAVKTMQAPTTINVMVNSNDITAKYCKQLAIKCTWLHIYSILVYCGWALYMYMYINPQIVNRS